MSVFTTQFQACQPIPWKGRYGRVMGDSSVFHLRYLDGRLWPALLWETDAGVASCRAIDGTATGELKANIFGAWPQENYLQVHSRARDSVGVPATTNSE